jgi:hypothetical protein
MRSRSEFADALTALRGSLMRLRSELLMRSRSDTLMRLRSESLMRLRSDTLMRHSPQPGIHLSASQDIDSA